jgi:hypothetical protein
MYADISQNLSHLYSILLFVQAVMKLVELLEKGKLPALSDKLNLARLSVCLYQACYRTLLDQSSNGSWNNSVEETAYGTLILCQARQLDLFRDFEHILCSAIDSAAAYIRSFDDNPPRYIWIEKVSYRSPLLVEAYKLSALKASNSRSDARTGSSLRQSTSFIPKLAKLWHMTPLFSAVPEWELRASMIEGTLFWPLVRDVRLSVFTRKGVEDDKYFDIIPLAWSTCNNRTRTFAPSCFLFEGMMAALLNFQVDEFMEAVASVNYAHHIPVLRQFIDDTIDGTRSEASARDNAAGVVNGSPIGVTNRSRIVGEIHHYKPDISESLCEEVLVPLQKFITRALQHPTILSASPWDRKNMTCELRIYLQTHLNQSEDNVLVKEKTFGKGVMREHFFRWVRTTSADHTSATYTFNFMSCLLSSWIENGQDCFPSTQEKYYGAAACQHLAAMCRMYNDHGSAMRDIEEGNLNSIHFPEFRSDLTGRSCPIEGVAINLDARKDSLFEVAQYERACLEEALRRLEQHSWETKSLEAQARKRRQMEIWRMFYNVTDLFGQIYVLRDIGSRLAVGSTT